MLLPGPPRCVPDALPAGSTALEGPRSAPPARRESPAGSPRLHGDAGRRCRPRRRAARYLPAAPLVRPPGCRVDLSRQDIFCPLGGVGVSAVPEADEGYGLPPRPVAGHVLGQRLVDYGGSGLVRLL